MYRFFGELESSKSILNRLQIVKSYFPELEIQGTSFSEDVQFLKAALGNLHSADLNAGEGGTTFRFLALRVARNKGQFQIHASPRLLARPQQEVLNILKQLGVSVQTFADQWVLDSSGWQIPTSPLKVSVEQSSQFVSALLLNSWSLPSNLQMELVGKMVSEPYLQMTVQILRQLGMEIHWQDHLIEVPAQQKILKFQFSAEPDISSAFVVAAKAVLLGHVHIQNFPEKSVQADFKFLQAFREMGVNYSLNDQGLEVQQSESLRPLHFDLKDCPDLFPVLASLCAFVDGESVLDGAPHLRLKESDRISSVARLFDLMGVSYEILPGGMKIQGHRQRTFPSVQMNYDPAKDHRMVMAAHLFQAMGCPLQILDPDCVAKSFSNFWEVMEGKS